MRNHEANRATTPLGTNDPLQRTLRRIERTFADVPVWRRGRAG